MLVKTNAHTKIPPDEVLYTCLFVAVETLESALVSMVNKLRDADSKSSTKPTAEVKGHHRVYNSKHNQNRSADSTKV